jgi:uncharacterized protein (DUF1697 family)
MSAVVALLRGINVGGNRTVPMATLRSVVEDAGHARVATHLNSGNVVLVPRGGASGVAGVAGVAAEIADGLRARLGFDVDVIVRTTAELDDVVAANPFPDAARDDPAHLLVMFYARSVTVDPSFDLTRYGTEEVVWAGTHAYLHYPDGIGRSKVTPAVLARAAGRDGTGRNWRTVLALRDLLHARDLPGTNPPDTRDRAPGAD